MVTTKPKRTKGLEDVDDDTGMPSINRVSDQDVGGADTEPVAIPIASTSGDGASASRETSKEEVSKNNDKTRKNQLSFIESTGPGAFSVLVSEQLESNVLKAKRDVQTGFSVIPALQTAEQTMSLEVNAGEERHLEEASAPVVAELAPHVDEVAAIVRRRVEDQLATELQHLEEQRLQTHLVHGVAIPDGDTSTGQAKEGDKKDTHFYISGMKAKTYVLILVALVVIGGAIGGAVAALGGGGNSEPSIDVTDSPTMSPTQPPTSAPTATPNPRREYLLQLLEQKFTSDEWRALLEDPLSPQSQALTWMSEEDTYFMNLEEIEVQLLLERFALAVLFYSTSGPNWFGNFSFLDVSTSVCIWNDGGKIGVFCADASNFDVVTILSLSDMGMIGTIPLEIGLLNSLTYLDLANNVLSGTIPSQLSDISSLQYIYFYSNILTGTLPSEWAEDLPSLRQLFLNDNQFHGTLPTELGRFSQLSNLILSQNDFSGAIPTEIGLLISLTWFICYDNNLEGPLPSEIGNLSLLDNLWVSSNKHLTGPVPATYDNLVNLQFFYFHDTSLTGSVDSMFCEDSSPPVLWGDCLGTSPEMECSCCSYCCMTNGITCRYV